MSDLVEKLESMAGSISSCLYGAVGDAKQKRLDWAMVALDEAASMLGRMQEFVEAAMDKEE